MKVLSLFDGMGCLGIALKDMGYEFEYYTSEIDKHAIAQSKLNFPDSVQLGDVTKWGEWDIDWSKIDVIGAGSPCQGFSFAGKQLAFDDPRSALFFVFVEILKHCKKANPNVKFLLENVKMKKEHELVITRYVNVAPIEINAALVSAQNRVRLFWTNIANEPYGFFGDMQCTIPQPKDKGILLKDILDSEVEQKYFVSKKLVEKIKRYNNGERCLTTGEKSLCLAAGYYKQGRDNQYIVASRGRNSENPKSRESGLPTEQHLEQRLDGKTNCITAAKFDFMQYTQDFKIRRLTPTECARLQSIPTWYKWNCSDTQAYKMLGNGWNVEVIKHILKHI